MGGPGFIGNDHRAGAPIPVVALGVRRPNAKDFQFHRVRFARLKLRCRQLQWLDLASRPPLAIAYAKQLVDIAGTVTAEEGMTREAQAQLVCILSDDAKEAVAAAFEKRPGSYNGT